MTSKAMSYVEALLRRLQRQAWHETLVQNRARFDKHVYTSLPDAIQELERRRADPKLRERIEAALNHDIPAPLRTDPRAVLFRQVITPNYETRRFLSITDSLPIKPLFFDHSDDKYVANNEWKYHLGRLCFYKGQDQSGNAQKEYLKIIDFNAYDGKPISSVRTFSNESLVDFHRSFFLSRFPDHEQDLFFASPWIQKQRLEGNGYYESVLMLFLCHGILFENFMLDSKEARFTRDIFLPAFIKVHKRFRLKPLIVNLEPTDIEGDSFWMYHPFEDKAYAEERLRAPVV